MKNLASFGAALMLSLALSGCALALRTPAISDLQRYPARYADRTVSVNGTVTTSWGVPLVPFKFYKISDGTGELTVVSQGSRLPVRGSRVRVKGNVQEIAVVGGQPVGLHLQERSVHVSRP